jgi:hypothetical protein
MTSWQISPGTERTELKDGRAEVVFTVTNPGPVDQRATVDVVGSEQAQSSWFNIAEPQQLIPHGGSKQFVATVKPDQKAPAGTYWLAGRVYSADAAPEEDSVTSDRVTFEVKPPPEKPKTKWWLWALIAAGIVAVVAGVVLFLVLRQEGPAGPASSDLVQVPQNLIGQDVSSAIVELQQLGLVAQVVATPSSKPKDQVVNADQSGLVHKGSAINLSVSTGSPVQVTLGPLPICMKNPKICVLKP